MSDFIENAGTEPEGGSANTRRGYNVAGTVASPDRPGVGGLYVEIVRRNIKRDVLLATAATDEHGRYTARFTELYGPRPPDLQVRVWASEAEDAVFLAASEVRYHATNHETLDIMLPANCAALPSEYETLTGALAKRYDGLLGELDEDEREEITYLAETSGYDARMCVMAALAERFAEPQDNGEGVTGLYPALYYALFRAGLPANDTLYQADAKTVEEIWRQAIERGVIPDTLGSEIPRAVQTFQTLSAGRALDARALPEASTLGEMLEVTFGDDPGSQRRFAELYTQLRDDPDALWDAVKESFGEGTEKRLRLDGQLYYLTGNDANLVRRLREAEDDDLSSATDLARHGYFRAEKWEDLLDGSVPDRIPGDTSREKRANYAEVLAAKVRLNFPTLVLAERVKSEEFSLSDDADDGERDAVYDFLAGHQGEFEIGMEPIGRYIARNDLNDQVNGPTKKQIERLQRVYALTPSDEAMQVLLDKKFNLDSANKIVGHNEAEFVQKLGGELDDLNGEENARLIYQRAQQVHGAVLNIASSYLHARTSPTLGSDPEAMLLNIAPDARATEDDAGSDVIAYPTLERLFGSMDYCACEHCRSILSPAAYMVDLLRFIEGNPQKVLLERRPDIQHLALTCENTNTPIPYIDVVNETLEHYVVNGLSLADYTGHDTDDGATAAELLASPQFVKDEAYDTLQSEAFPPPMPFHRPLEALRRYFDKFGVPLERAMETLRENDEVDRPNDAAYGWRDILMEQLKLSRAEYRPLTDRTLSLQQLYGYESETPVDEVLSGLANAKAFARRVRVKYEDVIQLLKTKFINPNSALIPRLERFGVPVATLKALKEGTISGDDFDALLRRAGIDPDDPDYGGDVKAWVTNEANYAKIMGLIQLITPTKVWTASSRYSNGDLVEPSLPPAGFTLYYECTTPGTSGASEPNPWPTTPGSTCADGSVVWTCRSDSNSCNFDKLEFRYADPDNDVNSLRAIDYVRLIRFIRLWRKLGWTIEQTDKAITALYPADDPPTDGDQEADLQRLDNGFRALLPRLGVAQKVMERLDLTPTKDLLGLLACWSPIDTHGADSLYHRMFLSSALAKQDNAFADDGHGNFLQDDRRLIEHTETLRAAFNLTAEEFSLILAELDFDDSTPLTLDKISAVYRHGWLARSLRLSVREFLLLITYTGLDPFAAAPDPPNPPVWQLLDTVEALRSAALQPSQALYFVWNEDISGRSRPDDTQITDLARRMRADFADIESQFTVAEDPNGDVARARMTLVYGNATDFFFGLLGNTLSVEYDHPQDTLEQAIIDAAAGRIIYDESHKRLLYSGGLSEATRAALRAVPEVSAEFIAAVDGLFAASEERKAVDVVFATSDAPMTGFFARYPELLPPLSVYAASTESPETKRIALLANFLPELKERRKRQQALAAVGAASRTDVTFAQAVLDDTMVLHAEKDDTQSAVHDLIALETWGLSAQSDTWSGYLEVPENGAYKFVVEADPSATVTFTLDAKIVGREDQVNLTAGRLYAVKLDVEGTTEAPVLRWQVAAHGWEVVPARHLYSATLIDNLRSTYVRFLKTLAFASGLKLTANEIAHFARHADYKVGERGWLNALPGSAAPDPSTWQLSTWKALHKALSALLDFARIKAALAPNDERLLAVLQDPAATLPNGDSLLLTLTRWEDDSLGALLTRFRNPEGHPLSQSDLAHLDNFRRIHDAYALVTAFVISASALIKATTNEPSADTVRDLQSALRARYDASGWLDVLKSINDVMRDLQRDALVVYVLHKLGQNPEYGHINTPEKLFEYFLMDVQMEPCAETSRIRHALSSIQLFIERCLMNLEPQVDPASIMAAQWEWMKRYRVWEANRKVFLWPENWLEPELRNDQSSFFKEAMSELLQSDITEDAAATALLNYLSKLEEVAKLEPCGIHYEEGRGIAHVVARTAGAKRGYYYRQHRDGYWTPWEEIKLDIEDNPVVPVVWKNRIFLFWLKILQQTLVNPADLPVYTSAPSGPLAQLSLDAVRNTARADAIKHMKVVRPQAVLCWSEYYNGRWQPAKTSDANNPASFDTHNASGVGAFDRQNLLLWASEEPGPPAEDSGDAPKQSPALRLRILGQGNPTSFLFYNTHSLPVPQTDEPLDRIPGIGEGLERTRELKPSGPKTNPPFEFSISYGPIGDGKVERRILSNVQISYRTVAQHQYSYRKGAKQGSFLQNVWEAPFFFEDSRHVFYVRTTKEKNKIDEFAGFGVEVPRRKAWDIPPLLVEPERLEMMRNSPIVEGPGTGAVSPSLAERLVTGDANIRFVLGTSTSVSYDDQEIGPEGALPDRQT